jgi:hypothetical protein
MGPTSNFINLLLFGKEKNMQIRRAVIANVFKNEGHKGEGLRLTISMMRTPTKKKNAETIPERAVVRITELTTIAGIQPDVM